MPTEITMPKLGLSMVTGKVGRWLVPEGNPVQKGDALLEIMTDKITNVVEAPAAGILLKAVAAEGAELPIGALLGLIGAAEEKIPEEPSIPLDEKIKVSPIARKIAAEKGLDLSRVTGTGPSGRIVREDVEKALAEAPGPAASPTVRPAESAPAEPPFTVIPYSGMRRAIGDNLAHSWAVAPKVSYHVSVDATALLALRQSLNEDSGEKITLTDLLVKIAAKALKLRPQINIALDGDHIRCYREPHIGVAVALDNGLVVPVIRNAAIKTLSDISQEIRLLAGRAKTGQLTLEEMQGGTFTITNVGAYNSVDWFTPILHQPEAAILGIGRILETPAVNAGQIVIRPLLGLSLAFDHRIIDGAPAAEFLAVLLKLIENPCRALA